MAEETAADVAETETAAAVDADTTTTTPDVPPEYVESIARRMGWKPDKVTRTGKVMSADEYLESFPGRQEWLAGKLRDVEGQMQAVSKHHQTAIENARKQARAEAEAELKAAIEAGDGTAYIAAQRKLDEANRAPEPTEVHPSAPPEFSSWLAENAWFQNDGELNAAAVAYDATLLKRNPEMPLADRLAKTASQVRRLFPEKFGGETATAKASPVEGSRPGTTRAGPKWGDVPSEGQKIFDTMFKAGAWGKQSRTEAQKVYMREAGYE